MATQNQLNNLYARATEQFRRNPSEAELDSWLSVLGNYEIGDIKNALDCWIADVTVEEFTGRTKGSRMPSPSEIKLLVRNEVRAQTSKFKACWEDGCVDGWRLTLQGVTPNSNKVDSVAGAAYRCDCFHRWVSSRRAA